jgi:hypothetical protein
MRRLLLAASLLACGACAHAPLPAEKPPLAFAVIDLGDPEAQKGCVMALLDGGFRVVGQKAIDAALDNPDTTSYKRLGRAVQADLIIDGGFTREKNNRKRLSARLVSAQSGDVLASSRVEKPDKKPFVTGQKVCTDLLQQLP